MKKYKTLYKWQNSESANKLLILLHAGGAYADNTFLIADYLEVKNFHLAAPQAPNTFWYPGSLTAPISENEPFLERSLEQLGETVSEVIEKGILQENIYFFGFSQGACLALEFIARNPKRYGGVAALAGGFVGDVLNASKYIGDLDNTPVFVGTSDPNIYIPVERVNTSCEILTAMGANLIKKIYPNMEHQINEDEIDTANNYIFNVN